MRDPLMPKLVKWPFFCADALLLALAYFIYAQSELPMGAGELLFCFAAVAVGAVFGILPFRLQYLAAIKFAEARELSSAVAQIGHLKEIQERIAQATGQWQQVQEQSAQTVSASKSIADRMKQEAMEFCQSLEKADNLEKNHLRLEVEKARRSESEWLQVTIRILDHVFALYLAAARSGHDNLITQIGQFQHACRDVVRRMGLVAFAAAPGEPFDAKLHQLIDGDPENGSGSFISQTIATGFTYQGQLLRRAVVAIQPSRGASELPAVDGYPSVFPQLEKDKPRDLRPDHGSDLGQESV